MATDSQRSLQQIDGPTAYNTHEIIEDVRLLYLSFNAMMNNIQLSDKKVMFKTYENCFSGDEAISHVMNRTSEMQKQLFENTSTGPGFIIRQRDEAKRILQLWLDAGLISGAKESTEFRSGDLNVFKLTRKAELLKLDIEGHTFYLKTLGSDSAITTEDELCDGGNLVYFNLKHSDGSVRGKTETPTFSKDVTELLFTKMLHSLFHGQTGDSTVVNSPQSASQTEISEDDGVRRRSSSMPSSSLLKQDVKAQLSDLKAPKKGLTGADAVNWLLQNTSVSNRDVARELMFFFWRTGLLYVLKRDGEIDANPSSFDDRTKITPTPYGKGLLNPMVTNALGSIETEGKETEIDETSNERLPPRLMQQTGKPFGAASNPVWRTLRVNVAKARNIMRSSELTEEMNSAPTSPLSPVSVEITGTDSDDYLSRLRTRTRSQSVSDAGSATANALSPRSLAAVISPSSDMNLTVISAQNSPHSSNINLNGSQILNAAKKVSPALRLKKILETPILLTHFTDFMRRQYREENLTFWLEVEKFRNKYSLITNLSPSDEESLSKEAKEICEQYILPGAPMELNIEGKQLAAFRTQHKEESQDTKFYNFKMFDNLQTIIFEMMALESTAKFFESEEYASAMQEDQSELEKPKKRWFNLRRGSTGAFTTSPQTAIYEPPKSPVDITELLTSASAWSDTPPASTSNLSGQDKPRRENLKFI